MAYKVVNLRTRKNVYPDECFASMKLANEFKSHAKRIVPSGRYGVRKCSKKEMSELELVKK